MVLNRFQMAAVKRTAQNTKKLVAQREKINEKMRTLAAELISINEQIDAWEAPIKIMTGGYTSEQMLSWEGVTPEENSQVADVTPENIAPEVINDEQVF